MLRTVRDERRAQPPKGVVDAEPSTFKKGDQVHLVANVHAGSVELFFTVISDPVLDSAAGGYRVDLRDDQGNILPWLVRSR